MYMYVFDHGLIYLQVSAFICTWKKLMVCIDMKETDGL